MKKRLLLGLALLGLTLLVAGLVFEWQAAPLVYQHQSLKLWVVQLSSADPKARDQAAAAFRQLGAKAVPELSRLLQAEESPARARLWRLSLKLPMPWRGPVALRVGPPDAASLRAAAARALGLLGPEARGALPLLSHALRDGDPQVPWAAAAALVAIGPEAVPALSETLEDPKPVTRHAAAYALGQIGPRAEAAVPGLLRCLGDPDETVRLTAAASLSRIGPWPAAALVEALGQGNAKTRLAMAKLLPQVYRSLRKAVPTLAQMAQDPDPAVRQAGIETLGELRAADSSAFTNILAALKDPVPAVKLAALKALGLSTWKGQSAVPELTACLRDDSPEVRALAARLLGAIGSPAQPAVAELARLAQDEAPTVRTAARAALSQLQPGALNTHSDQQ